MDHPIYQLIDRIVPWPTASVILKIIVTIGAKFLCFTILKNVYECLKPCIPWTESERLLVHERINHTEFLRMNSRSPSSDDFDSRPRMFPTSPSTCNSDESPNPIIVDNNNVDFSNTDTPMTDENFEKASAILLASINARRSRRAMAVQSTD